jgi:hypothetical protein
MRFRLALCLTALVAAGCTDTRGDIVGEFGGPSLPSTATTTLPATTSTVTLPVIALPDEIGEIQQAVATYRELDTSRITWELSDAGDIADLGFQPSEPGQNVARGYPERFLAMLGVSGEEAEPYTSAAVYDPESRAVYVAEVDELTPLGRVQVFEAFTAAATDARYHWFREMDRRDRASDIDGAWALWALVAGDARFTSEVYVENEFNATDAFALQFERIEQQKGTEAVAGYVISKRDFPTVAGRNFVEELVSSGGFGFVNGAYTKPPATSEQILHPSRYFIREEALAVALPELNLSGYEIVEEGTLGERGLQALFSDGVSNAQRLQAATGWGGDSYRVWWDGEETVMLVMLEGDTARDAAEINETIGGWALNSLPVGSGLADHRGLAFSGVESYAFTATDASMVLMVVATDPDAGRFVRDYFWPGF